uniref:26S proteasome non-ATPase regulatory subunit 13 n=1 Tax=Ditylenchus dipsaci TaxID=166011 RepID=A0A915DK86_9BILA
MSDKVEAYLSNQKNNVKQVDVAESFQKLETFYTSKHWKQLGEETLKLVNDKNFSSVVDLKHFYESFVRDFENHISPLVLVQTVLPIASYIFEKDRVSAFEFLAKFDKTVAKDAQATIRLNAGQLELRLKNKDASGSCIDIVKTREMLELTQKKLDEIHGVTQVHASFYKVSAIYLREIGDYAAYYKESLRYLGCEDLSQLTLEEKRTQAQLLGFSALLGQDIYNFGELLVHPILKFLEGSSEQWLLDFLVAFNSGNLSKFHEFEKKWSQWPDIVKNRELLESKIRLLALMEIALSRPAKERNITFEEISQKAEVHLNKVKSVVNISWIQPRVLSLEQISAMADRIDVWRRDVESMESVVSKNAKEIIMKS